MNQGQLVVELVAGASTATSVLASSPLKILVPRHRGQSVWACLSSLGGGLVAGDEVDLSVTVGQGARCFLSTQASTKVYRNPAARPCSHRLSVRLAADSLLVLSPDPVQAFAESRCVQRQEFRLHPTSSLVLVDWLSAGRMACGERWAFTKYQSRNEVFFGDDRLLLDSVLLDNSGGPPHCACRLGRFNCLALVLLLGQSLRSNSDLLLKDVGGRSIERTGSLVISASPVSHGVLLRLAGESVEEVGREIRRHLAFVHDLLDDDPWSRKW